MAIAYDKEETAELPAVAFEIRKNLAPGGAFIVFLLQ